MHNSKKCFKHLFPFQGINPLVNYYVRRTSDFIAIENDYLPLKRFKFIYAYFDIYKFDLSDPVSSVDFVVPKSFWSQYRGSVPVINIDPASYQNVLYLGSDVDDIYRYYAVPKGTVITIEGGDVPYEVQFPDQYGCITPFGEYAGSVFTSAVPGLAFQGELSIPQGVIAVSEFFDPSDPASYHRQFHTYSASNASTSVAIVKMRSICIAYDGGLLIEPEWTGITPWPVFKGELVQIPGEAASPIQTTTVIAS